MSCCVYIHIECACDGPDKFVFEASNPNYLKNIPCQARVIMRVVHGRREHPPARSEAKDDSGKIRSERTCSAIVLVSQQYFTASAGCLTRENKIGFRAVLQATRSATWLNMRTHPEAAVTEWVRARIDRSIADDSVRMVGEDACGMRRLLLPCSQLAHSSR